MRRWFGRELGGGCRDAGGAWTLGRTGKREWGRAWAGVVGRWGGGVCGDHEEGGKGSWGGGGGGFGGCLGGCLAGGGRTGGKGVGGVGGGPGEAGRPWLTGSAMACE